MAKEKNKKYRQKVYIKRKFNKDKTKIDKILFYKNKKQLLEGKPEKTFIYNEKVKVIRDFKKQKTGNEKAIARYYREKSLKEGGTYKPSKFGLGTLLNIHGNKLSRTVTTKKYRTTTNQTIFTSRRKPISHWYMAYISVTIRIYLNGATIISRGRSPPIYRLEKYTNVKTYKAHPKGFSKNEEIEYLKQAIKNTLAPYGSNLKFTVLHWQIAYSIET